MNECVVARSGTLVAKGRGTHGIGPNVTEIIYPELSYTVQGALYDVYNELRHLEISEEGWESAFLIALEERGVPAQRQVECALHSPGLEIETVRI